MFKYISQTGLLIAAIVVLFSFQPAMACETDCKLSSGGKFDLQSMVREASDSNIIEAQYRDGRRHWRRHWRRHGRYRYRERSRDQNRPRPASGSQAGTNGGNAPAPGTNTPAASGGDRDNCFTNSTGDLICPQEQPSTPSESPSLSGPTVLPPSTVVENPEPPRIFPVPEAPVLPPVNTGNAGTAYEWPSNFVGTPEGGDVLGSITEPTAPPAAQCSAGPASTSNVTFTPSTEDFMNPERGFYLHIDTPGSLTAGNISGAVSKGHSVVLAAVDLGDFRSGPLSADFLNRLNQSFENVRKGGVKAIVRFAYDYCACPDAPLNVVLGHIQQLKPFFTENADVIAYVQAGFIGMWGEWHSSSNGLDSDANKLKIRDALMDAIPSSIMIQFRYPPDFPKWYNAPLAANQAFTGTTQARTAFHNDCYLANNTDLGTFPKGLTDPLKDYTNKMTEFVPFGGETCGTSEGSSQLRMSCADILREGKFFHQTYLNLYYDANFHARWKSEGCFNEVSRTQGYRFQLDKASHPTCVPRGSSFTVDVGLHNVGWSRIFSPRHLVIVLRHKTSGATITGAGVADMRALPPQSSAPVNLHVTVKVPDTAAAGQYDVLIGMPDVWETTSKDPRYSVRFANGNNGGQGWDAQAGLFRLGTTVNVE